VASTLLLAAASAGVAQTAAGSKPLVIVVPFTPGSGSDTLARAMSDALQQKLGRPVVVENRAGASGNIGTLNVARAAPDGTTLLLTANPIVQNVGLFKDVGYDPLTSFVPIVELATGRFALVTTATFAPGSVKDLVAYAKANPGKVNYASPGRGTPHHLAMELFQKSTGTTMVHIPYSGLAKSMTDLVGGHVSTMFVGLHSIKPFADEGKVKILGVASLERLATTPALPTVAEQGLPGFEVEAWYGLLAPRGTPPALVAQLNAVVNEILQRPDIAAALAGQGLDIVGGAPEKLGRLLASDLDKWLKVIKDANIAAE
jgi:tripartite-type tricarboxylate transporter receptor subunit TctC